MLVFVTSDDLHEAALFGEQSAACEVVCRFARGACGADRVGSESALTRGGAVAR